MRNTLKTFTLLAALTAIFVGIGYSMAGLNGMLIAFGLAVAMNLFSYWNSDKIVLKMYRAAPVDDTHPDPRVRAYASDVRDLAARAQMPLPKIYIIDQDQPNAFATGRNPENAAVAATRGLLEMLDRREIRGVMAHELAHVKHRDTLTMTVTATIAGAISTLANLAAFSGLSGDSERRGAGLLGIVVMILAPIAAALVQMAISRAREYEADRVGAEIARDPHALAAALEKIDAWSRRILNPTAERNPASGQLFIINPLAGRGADNLFSTHPATGNRIRALMDLAVKMGVSARAAPAAATAPARSAVPVTDAPAHQRQSAGAPRGPWG